MAALRWTGTRAQLAAALRALPAVLAGRAPDPLGLAKVVLGHVGNEMLALLAADFAAKSKGGAGKDGLVWNPLADVTLERRLRKGVLGTDRLVETGDLERTLTPGIGAVPSGATDQVFRTEPGAVTVGSADPKADFHQSGTPHMPARPIVPVNGDLPLAYEADIERAFTRGLIEAVEIMAREQR